jgi:hypothetical protein
MVVNMIQFSAQSAYLYLEYEWPVGVLLQIDRFVRNMPLISPFEGDQGDVSPMRHHANDRDIPLNSPSKGDFCHISRVCITRKSNLFQLVIHI